MVNPLVIMDSLEPTLNNIKYSLIEKTYLTDSHLQLIIQPITKSITYQAGQYILIEFPNGTFLPFSIANRPCASGKIELHIRLTPEDQLIQAFILKLARKPIITLKGPFGHCYYQNLANKLIIIAAGTGFAPAKALIEQIYAENNDKSCYLYWTVKKPSDFYLPQLPQDWQRQLTQFRFTPLCTQANEATKNNIIQCVLHDFTHLHDCQLYVFGPYSLAFDAFTAFESHGLDKKRFFSDVLA